MLCSGCEPADTMVGADDTMEVWRPPKLWLVAAFLVTNLTTALGRYFVQYNLKSIWRSTFTNHLKEKEFTLMPQWLRLSCLSDRLWHQRSAVRIHSSAKKSSHFYYKSYNYITRLEFKYLHWSTNLMLNKMPSQKVSKYSQRTTSNGCASIIQKARGRAPFKFQSFLQTRKRFVKQFKYLKTLQTNLKTQTGEVLVY